MRVHDSQAYGKMDVRRERISRILELREILMTRMTTFMPDIEDVDVAGRGCSSVGRASDRHVEAGSIPR